VVSISWLPTFLYVAWIRSKPRYLGFDRKSIGIWSCFERRSELGTIGVLYLLIVEGREVKWPFLLYTPSWPNTWSRTDPTPRLLSVDLLISHLY
jgi:hypothetical protein